MKEDRRKCFKCGIKPSDDPLVTLHRFPKPGRTNALRCELWAQYCFPTGSWHSSEFQSQLYTQHRMLCNRHFKITSFVDNTYRRLFKNAVPEKDDKMLTSLNLDESDSVATVKLIEAPSRMSQSSLESIVYNDGLHQNSVNDKCDSCKVVINELLAFVSNKLDIIAEPALVHVCASAFTDSDIENARLLAFKLLAPCKRITRRKEGYQQKSVQDIINIIKECNLDTMPIFVAKNLNKLPLVAVLNNDSTTKLKEFDVNDREMVEWPSATIEIESVKEEIMFSNDLIQNKHSENSHKVWKMPTIMFSGEAND